MTPDQLAKAQSVIEIKNCNGTNCAEHISCPRMAFERMLGKDLAGKSSVDLFSMAGYLSCAAVSCR
jgi:hypothetical protein